MNEIIYLCISWQQVFFCPSLSLSTWFLFLPLRFLWLLFSHTTPQQSCIHFIPFDFFSFTGAVPFYSHHIFYLYKFEHFSFCAHTNTHTHTFKICVYLRAASLNVCVNIFCAHILLYIHVNIGIDKSYFNCVKMHKCGHNVWSHKTHGLFYILHSIAQTNYWNWMKSTERAVHFSQNHYRWRFQQHGGKKCDSYLEMLVSLPVECAVMKTKMSDTRFRAKWKQVFNWLKSMWSFGRIKSQSLLQK